MKIEKTKNYRQFKLIGANREINEAHVKNLVSSISESNLLAYNPIIVNSKMEVIDGQHRLEAAKRLKTEIYYIVSDKSDIVETRLLNRANRSWSLLNYLKSYASEGIPEYISLWQFVDLYQVPVSTAIELACQVYDSAKGRALRNGTIQLGDLTEAHEIARKLMTLKPYCERGAFRSRTLIRTVRRMVSAGVTFEKLVEVLDKTGVKIKDNSNYRDMLRQFEDIVNFKKSKTITRLY